MPRLQLFGAWSAPALLALASSTPVKSPAHDVYWYVEHASTISAIPLAIGGFWIAIAQIRKARGAAESARDAARGAQQGIGRSTLLLLIPQLQRTEEELEKAIGGGQQDLTLSWITTWRWQASQLRGLIKLAAPDERDILKSIQRSMVATAAVKTDLLGTQNGDLVGKTREVRQTIAAVTNGLGEIAIVQGMQIGPINGY